MSVNELFNKANKLFLNQDYFRGLKIYELIWAKYPKNTRLHEEINKKLKKFKKPILQTFSHGEIKNFFPNINYVLLASKTYKEVTIFEDVSRKDYLKVNGYMALKK